MKTEIFEFTTTPILGARTKSFVGHTLACLFYSIMALLEFVHKRRSVRNQTKQAFVSSAWVAVAV
jgi:hypothetical protein